MLGQTLQLSPLSRKTLEPGLPGRQNKHVRADFFSLSADDLAEHGHIQAGCPLVPLALLGLDPLLRRVLSSLLGFVCLLPGGELFIRPRAGVSTRRDGQLLASVKGARMLAAGPAEPGKDMR